MADKKDSSKEVEKISPLNIENEGEFDDFVKKMVRVPPQGEGKNLKGGKKNTQSSN